MQKDIELKEEATAPAPTSILRVGPDEEFETLHGAASTLRAPTLRSLRTLPPCPTDPFRRSRTAAAIAQCTGGEEIQLQPGEHTLDTPLKVAASLVRAPGSEGEVLVVAMGTAVHWTDGVGTLRGIHFRQKVTSETDERHLIALLGGELVIDQCELEARGGCCVHATGLSDYDKEQLRRYPEKITVPPLLKLSGCRLTSKRGNGVKIEWGAGGEVVGCEVTAVHMTAVMVCDAADVAVRRNQIHDNEGAGVFLYGASGAHTVEDNEIFGCGLPGIEVTREADPVVRRNVVARGKATGILVRNSGKGTYEANEVSEHPRANVEVQGESEVVLRANRVRDGSHVGILFRGRSKGLAEDNEVWGHACPNVEVRARSDPTFRANRLHDGKHLGLLVRYGGRGTYEANEVSHHALGGVHVHKRARVVLTSNHAHGNRGRGIFVEGDASAELSENRVEGNRSDEPLKEPAKRLQQTWGQWMRWLGWMVLATLADSHEDVEEEYPANYEMYADPDYQGDFDGFMGEVVFDEAAELQFQAELAREKADEAIELARAEREEKERLEDLGIEALPPSPKIATEATSSTTASNVVV